MMKRKTAALIGAVVLAALGYWGWQTYGRSDRTAAPATVAVARGSVSQTVLATGQVEAKQLVSVGGRVSGQIETLAVVLGQDVKKDDLIVQIDSNDQENAVAQARANLANIAAQISATTANLSKAELEYARQQKLARSDYSSQQTLETAAADVEVYKANIAALEAQKSSAEINVKTAQTALSRTTIVAPISGTVVAVNVQQGQTVNATQSAPTMVKLADLDTVVIKAEISEADVVSLRPGQHASFTILGAPNRRFSTTVREVEPAPSALKDSDTISTDSAIYYNAILELPNEDRTLRIGMTTQVTITLAEAKDVLTVPAGALRRKGRDYFVTVVGPMGGLTEQQVEVGLNNKVTAEIKAGLTEGQQVVSAGQGAMGPGQGAGQAGSASRRIGPPMGF
ncbi:efflux RND transporter periplasmic adaptor subunit [Sinirhodobacter populi]|uniref:Efflux RND transporter periplasmic adaptor subunit n=2 Tax=Paenirhodobacter populi TaxID=2306993 RepID=A0A443KN45_9RHOB|nr:efflux RND transporter periplasmic adaptor subunit [Sinirhodobacter populi]